MRIGIVTQPLSGNYGGILQNYALQRVLKKMGHNPITIDFTPVTSIHIWLLSCCKTLLYKACGRRRRFYRFPTPPKRNELLMNFVMNHITLSNEVHQYTSSIIKKYQLDAIIVGSDQVWRPNYNSALQDMFLRFVGNKSVIKVAYAASFGVDCWEFSQKQSKQCMKLAKRFNAISVRESGGVALCETHLDVKAIEVLDPTLLLSADEYAEVCACVPTRTDPFLAAYVLDLTDDKRSLIIRLASERNLKVEWFSADNEIKLSMEEWLSMYRDAAYVVTDSFHGTVFSIINHKNFCSLINNNRGAERFVSLLKKFGLEQHLIICADIPEYRDDDIDWQMVDAIRKDWQTTSIQFLKNELHDNSKT